MPGVSSGGSTYGRMRSAGSRVQASSPASAMLAPSSLTKSRRDTSSSAMLRRYAWNASRRSSFMARSPVARGTRRRRGTVAVALDTPAHGERLHLTHLRHQVHATVTALAPDAVARVHRVVEENKIGNRGDALPLDRCALAQTASHRLERRAAEPEARVARHARPGRRETSHGGALRSRVTVHAA